MERDLGPNLAAVPDPDPPLRDEEPDVIVHRSLLGGSSWFCYAVGYGLDLTDFAHPGGLRAVQRYAEGEYVKRGQRWRWTRETPHAYRLRVSESSATV